MAKLQGSLTGHRSPELGGTQMPFENVALSALLCTLGAQTSNWLWSRRASLVVTRTRSIWLCNLIAQSP